MKKQEAPAKPTRPANASPIKESAESIVVAGKTYACHVAEEMRDGIQIKTWTSDKVPGGLVKMELRGDGTLMTTLLVESSIQK